MKQGLTRIFIVGFLALAAISCKRKYTCVCEGSDAGAVVEARDRYKAENLAEAEAKCYADHPGLDCNAH